MKTATTLVLLTGLAGAGISGARWYQRSSSAASPPFRTAQIVRGDLLATISATGTVEPEEVVDVGAQVAGQVDQFGTDLNGQLIDYGSEVDAGTVLARIDDALYAADVALASAELDQAKAGVVRADADLGQLRAKREDAELEWVRAEKLQPGDAMTRADYDAAHAAVEVARANVSVGEAAAVQARGAVAQAQSVLDRARKSLGYCTITAPVKGVIIDRRVNIGQTVVASLNAPSLFLIAKDLRRMQVWVSVNEADIASIHAGQSVSFTVDAEPSQEFTGEVKKVRLNAAMTQNVVTYTVEVVTDNADGKLLPYLTANVRFELQHDRDVLLVPNGALRWTPPPGQVLPPDPTAAVPEPESRQRTLWIPEGARVRPLTVRTGPTDGVTTEVEGEGVSEGMQVVTGEAHLNDSAPAASANPFTPQFNRSQGGGPNRQP